MMKLPFGLARPAAPAGFYPALTTLNRLLVLVFLAVAALFPNVAAAQDVPRVMIVMDGSGSMWGRISNRPKLKIAIQAVNRVMQRVPGDLEVGLMAYGHRSQGDCDDIQVLVRPAENTARKIRTALGGMQFQGKTPLAAALREAAERMDFRDRPVTVVMVTDGIESCRMNPCAVASELEAEGFDFTAHVIGFGLNAKQGALVSCIAKRTGGRYFPARNARALSAALTGAMFNAAPAASDPTVLSPSTPEPQAEAPAGIAPLAKAPSATAEYFRGAPVMMNVSLMPAGLVGIQAQPPAPQPFAATATAADCQMLCEGDLLCAAWSYAPPASGAAQCAVFDYATALDYVDTDPALGLVAGMKVGAVQLVRPYVPTAVPAPMIDAAPMPTADAAPVPQFDAAPSAPAVAVTVAPQETIAVDVRPFGAPDDLGVFWTATNMDDPEAVPIATDVPLIGAWQVALGAGEWVIEGAADGYIFEDFVTVSTSQTVFDIEAFATGDATNLDLDPDLDTAEDTADGEQMDAPPVSEPAAPEPSAPAAADTPAIVDGRWSGTLAAPDVSRCADGIVAGLDGARAEIGLPRDVVWGGAFDPTALNLGSDLASIAWVQTTPTEWQGQTPPFVIPGQPPFVRGVMTLTLAQFTPDSITGSVALTAFAEGDGMIGLLNAGLSQCRVTADVALSAGLQ